MNIPKRMTSIIVAVLGLLAFAGTANAQLDSADSPKTAGAAKYNYVEAAPAQPATAQPSVTEAIAAAATVEEAAPAITFVVTAPVVTTPTEIARPAVPEVTSTTVATVTRPPVPDTPDTPPPGSIIAPRAAVPDNPFDHLPVGVVVNRPSIPCGGARAC